MATRTRKTTAKKAATPAKKTTAAPARKATAKKAPAWPAKPAETVVDTREPLPVRRRLFTGPLGANEQAAVRAALAAASARLPVPVRAWNGSTAQLADGVLLIHNPSPDRLFTAHIACRHGAIHNHPISTGPDLREARAVTQACDRQHTEPTEHDGAELDWDKAIGPRKTPQAAVALVPVRAGATASQAVLALPAAPRVLGDQLTRATSATDDTQPLPRDEITAGLAARADNDQPKEHPQP
jgi:hypothetical protein